jgi:exonuclease III
MFIIKSKIISWNVRNLNDEKKMGIRGLLKGWKADIVYLQETKMEVITKEVGFVVYGVVIMRV